MGDVTSKGPYYRGRGEPNHDVRLPAVQPYRLQSAEGYVASNELAAAVDVALTLGMPLLLTGDPGSGKSRLAHSVAWELGLGDPLEFVTKSDTLGRDLFYSFDTVGRFHASNTGGASADPASFIAFNALGRAILYAREPAYAHEEIGLPPARVSHPGAARRSVVLIDEIDKAPRDVPNDILTEIEAMRFRVPELESAHGRELEIRLDDAQVTQVSTSNPLRPIVIITSNSERSLPDAFLRRCVYLHVAFPPFSVDMDKGADAPPVTVEAIVEKRLGARYTGSGDRFTASAIDFFRFLRDERLRFDRRPGMAELLNWLDLLLPETGNGLPSGIAEMEPDRLVTTVKTTLLKNKKDQSRAADLLDEWQAQTVKSGR